MENFCCGKMYGLHHLLLQLGRLRLLTAQRWQKSYVNRRRGPLKFEEGDQVRQAGETIVEVYWAL